jgi:sucrose phosphorylase|eukprot:g4285.t1
MWGTKEKTLVETLKHIYGDDSGARCFNALGQLLNNGTRPAKEQKSDPEEKDFNMPCLITYADSLVPDGVSSHATPKKRTEKASDSATSAVSPLQKLREFMSKPVVVDGQPECPKSLFQSVHLLPFYPWDTDRGFSVKDYREVDGRNGTWEDVEGLVHDGVSLMFDFVANHASVENPLIQASLIQRHAEAGMAQYKDVQRFQDFVLAYSENDSPSKDNLLKLARPRPNPVLTSYYVVHSEASDRCRALLGDPDVDGMGEGERVIGTGSVWTTFSRGKGNDGVENTRQVDLNFANFNVLVEVVNILMYYVDRGARIIRLDAIGYIWKEIGSTSLHEQKAHAILEVLRIVLECLSPATIVIAEVNEPNSKLLPYLGHGKGHEECDMVYQFASYAMATHAVLRQTSTWYRTLVQVSRQFQGRQYVTLLGSHDGMAMKQAAELLPKEELAWLGTALSQEPRNCLVNYATKPGGEKIVYECCGTPWAIINGDGESGDDEPAVRAMKVARYLAVVGAGLSLRGMPAIYINGYLCSPNFFPAEGLDENRTILRQRLNPGQLEGLVKDGSYGDMGSKGILYLLKALRRPEVKAHFSANAPDPAIVVPKAEGSGANDRVLCVRLDAHGEGSTLILIVNMSEESQRVEMDGASILTPPAAPAAIVAQDTLHFEKAIGTSCSVTVIGTAVVVNVPAYGQAWVKVNYES